MHDLNLRVRTGVVDDPWPVDATGKDDNVVDLNPILWRQRESQMTRYDFNDKNWFLETLCIHHKLERDGHCCRYDRPLVNARK